MRHALITAIACGCLASPALAGEQRCSGPMRRSAAEFQVSADGTEVMDQKNGLIWRRCIEGQTWTGTNCQADDDHAVNPGPRMTYQEAQRFAASVSTPDKSWRLPTSRELATLREPNCYNPSFSLDLFPTSPEWRSDGFFWTTTPEGGGLALVTAIGTSDAHASPAPDHTNHVRLVRTAKAVAR